MTQPKINKLDHYCKGCPKCMPENYEDSDSVLSHLASEVEKMNDGDLGVAEYENGYRDALDRILTLINNFKK